MSRKRLLKPFHQRRRRLVGDEMARELARDVLRGRGMAREIGEHAAALLDAGVVVALADHGLRAGLVHARIEDEHAAALGVLPRRNDSPAGDDLGETGDVVLRVDAAHAERMQLENLARQILVEAAAAVLAGARIRADRARIVEIDQHRRMALDREQHVAEAAEHIARGSPRARTRRRSAAPAPCRRKRRNGSTRTRRGARQSRSRRRARCRAAPWPRRDRSPAARCRRTAAAAPARCPPHFSAARSLAGRSSAAHSWAGRSWLLFGPLASRRIWRCASRNSTAARAAAPLLMRSVAAMRPASGAIELGDQRAARIGRDCRDRAGARSESEPMQRQRRLCFGIKCHMPPFDLSRFNVSHRTHRSHATRDAAESCRD